MYEIKETNNSLFNYLKTRILILSRIAWDNKISWLDVENWLNNFNGLTGYNIEDEKIHALFILSEYLYFGSQQIRTLLQALYRDHFFIPLIQKVRNENKQTRNVDEIKKLVIKELEFTRFLGIGNPSESGIHLLYYFRQENKLPVTFFEDIANLMIIKKDSTGNSCFELSNPNILRYIFIDDICGAGDTAIRYSNNLLHEIKSLNNNIEFHYLTLFGTEAGLNEVRRKTVFKNNCTAIFELDSTYKVLSDESRYFANYPELLNKNITSKIIKEYGLRLWKEHPLGYKDCQLLLGLNHNIPNNTIPIIWYDNDDFTWIPIFKRYEKNKEIEI